MKKTVTYCDICGSEDDITEETIQVIFTTEQTEGRGCEPYLSGHKLDICKVCKRSILKGNCLWGSGAQGYNKYYFKPDEELKSLKHHRDSTVGLWATDRPELITDMRKEKYHLFEIKYSG